MTYRCKCFKNPPLGVLGDSRQIELSSSIFLLRLQFNTLLALGNILGSILYLKIQKYLLKKFPEPLKFDPTWFGTPSGHKLSVKKIWLINFFVSDFVNLWFLVLRNISNNQRPDFVSGILLSWIQCSHRKNWHLFTHSHIYIYIYIYILSWWFRCLWCLLWLNNSWWRMDSVPEEIEWHCYFQPQLGWLKRDSEIYSFMKFGWDWTRSTVWRQMKQKTSFE